MVESHAPNGGRQYVITTIEDQERARTKEKAKNCRIQRGGLEQEEVGIFGQSFESKFGFSSPRSTLALWRSTGFECKSLRIKCVVSLLLSSCFPLQSLARRNDPPGFSSKTVRSYSLRRFNKFCFFSVKMSR